jgi:hypothetical protein
MSADDGQETFEIQRFREDRFGAELPMVDGKRRDDDDGDARKLWVALLLRAKFPSVHDRHHEIEQNHARRETRAQLVERLAAGV